MPYTNYSDLNSISPRRKLEERKIRKLLGDDAAMTAAMSSREPGRSLLGAQASLITRNLKPDEIAKIRRCSPRSRCHSSLCTECAVPKLNRVAATREQEARAAAGTQSRDPQVRAIQQARKYRRLPQSEVFAVTINFRYVDAESIVKAIGEIRKALRNFLDRDIADALILGWFEYPVKTEGDADSVAERETARGIDRDHQKHLLHLHALIHVPGWGKEELTRVLKAKFGASRQVMLTEIRHKYKGGVDLNGISGWVAYGTKEFIKFDGLEGAPLDQYVSALQAYMGVPRRTRRFEYGWRKLSDMESHEGTYDVVHDADDVQDNDLGHDENHDGVMHIMEHDGSELICDYDSDYETMNGSIDYEISDGEYDPDECLYCCNSIGRISPGPVALGLTNKCPVVGERFDQFDPLHPI